MNPTRQKDKRLNPLSRGKYGDSDIPIVTYGNDFLANYEFLQANKTPVRSGERDLLLALWKEGVEGYLRGKDPEETEWVLNGNVGQMELCTFNWIAKNLLHCDPDRIRVKLLELKQKKTRKLYLQIGFRQWTPEGKKAGFRRE